MFILIYASSANLLKPSKYSSIVNNMQKIMKDEGKGQGGGGGG